MIYDNTVTLRRLTEDFFCYSKAYNTTMISPFQVFSVISPAELQVIKHMMMSATSSELTLFVMPQNVYRSLQLLSLKAKTISNKSVHIASDNSQPAPKEER
jgi:hypothetical protein